MIDWFKMELLNRPAAVLKQKLPYNTLCNIEDGQEVGTFDECFLYIHPQKDCAISVKIYPSQRVVVQGSIHKFWKGNNYSIFTFQDMILAFKTLFEFLETSPEFAKILQIEYGMNFYLLFSPIVFLARIICFKYHEFNAMGNFKKIGRDCCLSEYRIKIYNKGNQCKLADNILRFEKKVTDSRYLKKFGITTIADLTIENAKILFKDLAACCDEVLVNDKSIDESKLTVRQRLALSNYRRPTYWSEISVDARKKAKGRFRALIAKYGSEIYQLEIKKHLENMGEKLLKEATPFPIKNKQIQATPFPKILSN